MKTISLILTRKSKELKAKNNLPEQKIVASAVRQLCWTHFTLLIPMKNELQREFYAHMCRIEGWFSVGTPQEN